MEKGVSKYWTLAKELEYQERLKRCRSFAERHVTLLMHDIMKYDGRSKQGKRVLAQAMLRIATASDRELREIAELETDMDEEERGEIPGLTRATVMAQNLEILLKARAEIKQRGIREEQLRGRG